MTPRSQLPPLHRRLPFAAVPPVVALLALVLVGCAAGAGDLGSVAPPIGSAEPSIDVPSAEPTPDATHPAASAPAASPGATTTVRAYFMRGSHTGSGGLAPVLRQVQSTQAVGAAAMNQLLEGPKGNELTADPALFTDIPSDTRFLGLTITEGVATVNLSTEFAAGGSSRTIAQRYGQVVYTLTQFPTVQGVRFELDGKPTGGVITDDTGGGGAGPVTWPVTRQNYVSLLPAIWVDRPAWGGALAKPGRITGLANTFEAQFRIQIVDGSDVIVADVAAHAGCGTGCWGTFDVTVPYAVGAAGWGTLRVFEESAKDGSKVNLVDYPVWLTP